jgi:hypothetical protein
MMPPFTVTVANSVMVVFVVLTAARGYRTHRRGDGVPGDRGRDHSHRTHGQDQCLRGRRLDRKQLGNHGDSARGRCAGHRHPRRRDDPGRGGVTDCNAVSAHRVSSHRSPRCCARTRTPPTTRSTKAYRATSAGAPAIRASSTPCTAPPRSRDHAPSRPIRANPHSGPVPPVSNALTDVAAGVTTAKPVPGTPLIGSRTCVVPGGKSWRIRTGNSVLTNQIRQSVVGTEDADNNRDYRSSDGKGSP